MLLIFNVVLGVMLSVLLFVPIFIVGLLVKFTSKGPVIHWSKRVGAHNKLFLMPKFRTMSIDTPQLPTHLMKDADNYLTPVGDLLRKTSLDELPQLYSVLKRDMNFVGPRPALFNQDDLVALRTQKGVHKLPPGITGWAQTNGRDEISIPQKVDLDEYYLKNRSLSLDIKIIILTLFKVLKKEDVSH